MQIFANGDGNMRNVGRSLLAPIQLVAAHAGPAMSAGFLHRLGLIRCTSGAGQLAPPSATL